MLPVVLRVVLVDPEGPLNVGLAQRACANFGPCSCFVVGGEGVVDHPDRRRAAHGVDGSPAVCATLDEALEGSTWACGFVGRARRHRRARPIAWAAPRLGERAADSTEVLALVFGNERTGLLDEQIEPLQELVTIPTSPEHPSLNLAGAVHVALAYVRTFPGQGGRSTRSGRPITFEERRLLVRRAEEALSARDDLDAPETRRAVRRLFGRAEIESRDARLWHRWFRRIGGS